MYVQCNIRVNRQTYDFLDGDKEEFRPSGEEQYHVLNT